MGTEITFRRGSNDPTSGSGITLAEPVFNTTLKTFHIGLGHGVTAAWVGAPISGLSADIAAGITYKTPTAKAVKDYVTAVGGSSITDYVISFNGLTGAVTGVTVGGANTFTALNTFSAGISTSTLTVSGGTTFTGNIAAPNIVNSVVAGTGISVSGATGAVTITNTGVQSFNGLTGAVQGVSAAVAGTGISVSGTTGSVTITNTGVQSFNGRTGAVTGASLGANTFTGLQTMTSGISAAGGMTLAGTLNTTGDIKFNGTTAKSITTTQAPLTIKGATSSVVSLAGYNAIVLGVQTTDPLKLWSASGVVDINSDKTTAFSTSIKLNTNDGNFEPLTASVTIQPSTYFTADRTLNIQDASGTIALTSQLMGAINGSTAATTAVTSFNGLTGAVGGVCAAQANTFTALQTFTTGISAAGGITFNGPVTGATATFTRLLTASGGISASGGMTLDGGKVWHSLNDGATSGLDAGLVHGVCGARFLENLQTGLLYGGLISVNAGNTGQVDISAGAGIVVSPGASLTAYPIPVVTPVTWATKTGVTLSGLTSSDETWLAIDSSGNLVQSTNSFTDAQYQSQIPLGAALHLSRTYIQLVKGYPHVSYAQPEQFDPFVRAFGNLKLSGHEVSANGANLQINRSAGKAYAMGRNYRNDPNNPNIVTDTSAIPVTYIYHFYRNGSGAFTTTIDGAIIPGSLDNGTGTLGTVTPAKFTIQRLFYLPDQPTLLGVYYGRQEYNSIVDAQANIPFEEFSESESTATQGIFCGWLIVRGNATALNDTATAKFVNAGLFRNTSNIGGGGLAIAVIDDLNDVTTTTPSNNQVLRWNSGTAQWVNSDVSSLAVSSFNGATGAVTGVTVGGANTFTALNTFSAGISAAGGVTLAGTFSGTTGSFSRLLTASAGITTSTLTTDYLVVAGGSTFGAAVNHAFGLSNRGLVINAGKGSSEILSYGNETLSVSGMGGNGSLELFGSTVTVGDDGNNDGTQIIVADGTQTITYSATQGHIFNGTGSFDARLTASAGISAAGTTAANFNGLVDMSFNTLFEPTLRYYNEVLASPSISANVLTLDLSTAQMFTVSLNANITTFTISNTPATANRSIGFTLIFTADGTARTVTWGAAVKWANNDPPALTSTNGKKDILSFVSPDGGTNWYGFIGGLNF